MASVLPPLLRDRLRARLPSGAKFAFHYLRSFASACDPIFAPAPHHATEPTTCESHFLSASVVHPNDSAQPVQVIALEVLAYSTTKLTTLFVSKADSTGFLGSADLPYGGRGVAKAVACAFLEYMVGEYRTPSKRLVVSLFARSQTQYLFPGSVENPGKHVLDDRMLIRWWCGILDTAVAASGKATGTAVSNTNGVAGITAAVPIAQSPSPTPPQAYLAIPGLDAYEVRAYWPRSSATTWHADTPLRELADNLNVPPRCLIPRFPDDPKTRFALDLDDELPENGPQPAHSPAKHPPGYWRSVRSLEQFWELMAYRQECSAGRVVGFLWGVFEPTGRPTGDDTGLIDAATETTGSAVNGDPKPALKESRSVEEPEEPQKALLALENSDGEVAENLSVPLPTAEALSVNAAIYTEITELLQQLDYAGLDLARESTKRFLANAASKAAVSQAWGVSITGEAGPSVSEPTQPAVLTNGTTPAINTLGAGYIRKRKKPKADEPEDEQKRAKLEA